MSTRACYRFISPPKSIYGRDHTVTVYKHSDGYPDGAVRWIEAALEYSWNLPRFETTDFSAAFIAANKGQQTYYARLIREEEAKPETPRRAERLKHLRESLADYSPGGRYFDMAGGGVRCVPFPGMNAHWRFARDTAYLYDITAQDKDLVITAYSVGGKWDAKTPTLTKIFHGTLTQMKLWTGKDLIERYTEELKELRAETKPDKYRATRIENLEEELAELEAYQQAFG